MMKPEPELRRSSGGPGGSAPSGLGSAARRTRTCTRAGLSRSASPFMKSLSRAISGGGALPWLSFQSGSAAQRGGAAMARISREAGRARKTSGERTRIVNPPGAGSKRSGRQYTARGQPRARASLALDLAEEVAQLGEGRLGGAGPARTGRTRQRNRPPALAPAGRGAREHGRGTDLRVGEHAEQ